MNICTVCQQPISLLTSQRNGNLDTCLKCAIEQSPLLLYTLKRRDQTVIVEIICQSHYREHAQPGRGMAPLSVQEEAAGVKQIVIPYDGDRTCETCEQAQRRKVVA